MKYEKVWKAVDKLAEKNGLSTSGLAKKAGLDATTFNKSKRLRDDGKKRWPSLDSINRLLEMFNISFEQFYAMSGAKDNGEAQNKIPYVNYSKLSSKKTVDNALNTSSWRKINFPEELGDIYAIDIDSVEFEPIYEKCSIIIASKSGDVRRGDRVIIFMENGKKNIGEFKKRTASTLEMSKIGKGKDFAVNIKDIKFINRIVWASQ